MDFWDLLDNLILLLVWFGVFLMGYTLGRYHRNNSLNELQELKEQVDILYADRDKLIEIFEKELLSKPTVKF